MASKQPFLKRMGTLLALTATLSMTTPAAKADILDDLADGLESISGTNPMDKLGLSGFITLLQGIGDLVSLIPGLGAISEGINKILGYTEDVRLALGPIMQVAKSSAQYVRTAADGRKTLQQLFNSHDLNDATTHINHLLSLSGITAKTSSEALKNNPAAVAEGIVDQFDAQLKNMTAQYNSATDEGTRAAIRNRIAYLSQMRSTATHAASAARSVMTNQRQTAKLHIIAENQAKTSMTMVAASLSASKESTIAKLNVAATTEQTTALTAGLAAISQQLGEQSALALANNESIDILAEEVIVRNAQSIAVERLRREEELARIEARYEAGMKNSTIVKDAMQSGLGSK